MHDGVRACVCPSVSALCSVLLAVALVIGAAVDAHAQLYESVGIRAQGMAGSFVAVADDATATWWNPAGLAGGGYFTAIVEAQANREPPAERDAAGRLQGAWRGSARGFAMALPAIGLGYYRLRVSEMQPAATTASSPLGRLDQRPADVRLRTLALHQFGATAGQSIGEHLVIASTVKLLHGSLGAAVRTDVAATLDGADDLDGAGETHGDLDVGVMASWGGARIGASAKNLTAPTFGEGPDQLRLGRQVRAGVAASTNRTSLGAGATFAFDVDLTKTMTASGEERHVAAGVEAWSPSRRYQLRGGVSANTTGEARPAASGGASVALRSGLYLDVAGNAGADKALRGWGLALRVTF